MTKKVPEHIKNFFLYRTWYNGIHRHEKCLGLIIVGKTGSGKSWLALRIAEDLDPTFDPVTRVVYTAEDFMHLVAYGNLKRGQAIIFDELAHAEGGDSRASMSRTNRLLGGIVSTYRQLGLIVIFVLPTLTQLDKNLRMVSIDGYFVINSIDYKENKTIAEFRVNDLNVVMGKSYYKYPVVVNEKKKTVKVTNFRFDRPSKKMTDAYKKRKLEFVRYIAKKAADENNPMLVDVDKPKSIKDYAAEIMKDLDKYLVKGRVDRATIEAELGVGRLKAQSIAGWVQRTISKDSGV